MCPTALHPIPHHPGSCPTGQTYSFPLHPSPPLLWPRVAGCALPLSTPCLTTLVLAPLPERAPHRVSSHHVPGSTGLPLIMLPVTPLPINAQAGPGPTPASDLGDSPCVCPPWRTGADGAGRGWYPKRSHPVILLAARRPHKGPCAHFSDHNCSHPLRLGKHVLLVTAAAIHPGSRSNSHALTLS